MDKKEQEWQNEKKNKGRLNTITKSVKPENQNQTHNVERKVLRRSIKKGSKNRNNSWRVQQPLKSGFSVRTGFNGCFRFDGMLV